MNALRLLAAAMLALSAAGSWAAAEAPIDIDRYLAEPPAPIAKPLPAAWEPLRARLAEQVRALVEGPRLAPLRMEIGLAGCEFFFDHSGQTVLSLSLAARHLPPDLRGKLADYLEAEIRKYPPHTSGCWYPINEGRRRENYVVTDELLAGSRRQALAHPFGNVYALWAMAHELDCWPPVAERWPEIRDSYRSFRESGWRLDPAKGDLFANRYLAALVAYVRIARRMNEPTEAEAARRQAEELAAGIVENWRRDSQSVLIPKFENVVEFDRWRGEGAGGFFFRVSGHKAKVARFHDLTPEVARLVADHALPAAKVYLDFVDRSLPGWYLAGEERQFHFGENYVDYPDFAMDIFLAKAYLEKSPPEKLAGWVDMPWCAGDLYYIEKLALVLDAAAAMP